jgi:hypothetical protein
MATAVFATMSSARFADGGRPPDAVAVGARIDAIVAGIREPEFDDELWESSALREMYRNSTLFLPGIESYLRTNPAAAEIKAHVALLALQCLPLGQYLGFTSRLAKAGKGEIGEWALFYSVVPGFEWSLRLGLEYKDARVRAVLSDVAASANADDQVRSAVEGILRGDVARTAKRDKDRALLKCHGD